MQFPTRNRFLLRIVLFGCHGQVQILQGAGAFCSLVVFYPDAFEIFHKSNYKRLLTLMSKEMIYETASNTNTRNSCDLFIFTLFLFRMFSLFHYEIMPSISESRDKFTSWRRIFEFIVFLEGTVTNLAI